MTPFVVPDSVEPLVGWRYWKVTLDGLRSVVLDQVWPRDAALAADCRCSHFGGDEDAPAIVHEAIPEPSGSCGIYAAKDLLTLMEVCHPRNPFEMLYEPTLLAVGEVYLWGKVIPAQRGYRAQYAYPKSISLISSDSVPVFALEALEHWYCLPIGIADEKDVVGNPWERVRGQLQRAMTLVQQQPTLVYGATARAYAKSTKEQRDQGVWRWARIIRRQTG